LFWFKYSKQAVWIPALRGLLGFLDYPFLKNEATMPVIMSAVEELALLEQGAEYEEGLLQVSPQQQQQSQRSWRRAGLAAAALTLVVGTVAYMKQPAHTTQAATFGLEGVVSLSWEDSKAANTSKLEAEDTKQMFQEAAKYVAEHPEKAKLDKHDAKKHPTQVSEADLAITNHPAKVHQAQEDPDAAKKDVKAAEPDAKEEEEKNPDAPDAKEEEGVVLAVTTHEHQVTEIEKYKAEKAAQEEDCGECIKNNAETHPEDAKEAKKMVKEDPDAAKKDVKEAEAGSQAPGQDVKNREEYALLAKNNEEKNPNAVKEAQEDDKSKTGVEKLAWEEPVAVAEDVYEKEAAIPE